MKFKVLSSNVGANSAQTPPGGGLQSLQIDGCSVFRVWCVNTNVVLPDIDCHYQQI